MASINRKVLPGFSLSLSYSVFYLGILVLLPIFACLFRAGSLSFEEFWTLRSEMSGTLRDKLSTLSVDEKEAVTAEVKAATGEFFSQGQMKFPAEMIIVTGAKNGNGERARGR